ncbi:MAG: alpha/beta hydrolase family protein [Acidimicrobiia bacterium]
MIHPIDLLAPVGFRLDRRSKIFVGGWGDPESVDLLDRGLTAADALPDLALEWSRKEEHRGFRIRRSSATSPVAGLLPPNTRAMTVEWIEPSQGSDRVVILLPAWNDEHFTVRRKFATALAAKGISSMIADVAFYGARRIHPTSTPAVRTVGEFAVMGYSAVAEARGLVATATAMGRGGVAGYSMGGNLAAQVSATVARPIATAPLAASHGPAPVYLDGALRRAIDWRALGGRDAARPRLEETLAKASVLHLPPMAHHPAAVLMSAARDGFVLPEFSRDLAAHWGAELRTVHGAGHGTMLWRHRPLLIDAIVDSFDRLPTG